MLPNREALSPSSPVPRAKESWPWRERAGSSRSSARSAGSRGVTSQFCPRQRRERRVADAGSVCQNWSFSNSPEGGAEHPTPGGPAVPRAEGSWRPPGRSRSARAHLSHQERRRPGDEETATKGGEVTCKAPFVKEQDLHPPGQVLDLQVKNHWRGRR
ncbi:serine palmitoyltransferase small subunit B isoform X2 [Nycticebus coucang]|uniref:serine palmitoyltransferase small subunit B isoform X2 n=1 Tax=Nycticebus coucang TaxID=9470 RepID=UPI00234D1117|nr:serine palmitoyltransferase small subunit B isoform X2 [Nycticebus coucang]